WWPSASRCSPGAGCGACSTRSSTSGCSRWATTCGRPARRGAGGETVQLALVAQRRRTPAASHSASAGAALPGAALDAQLGALGVAQNPPAGAVGPPQVVHQGGADVEQPGDFLVPGALGRPEIEVHPVLHGLALGYGDEQQADPVRGHDPAR